MSENSTQSYLSPGQKLGKYEIKSLLGRGGMAEVYRALNPDLNQDVAIKVLHPYATDSTNMRNRFRQEAQSIAALSHPNIIRVFDFDTQNNIYFMVMELINGPTLRDILAKYPQGLPVPEALRIFKHLAEAVAYAHEQGIVHRDIKPGNVLMANGSRPVLTDFGLARILGDAAATVSTHSSGTPAYMSPEQASGGDIGPRSDIYTLGVMLYELITGDVPFTGDSAVAIVMQHLQNLPPRPSATVPDLDPHIENVILKALEKNPQDRFASAHEMIRALDSTAPVTAYEPLSATYMTGQFGPNVTRLGSGTRANTTVFQNTVVAMQRNPVLTAGGFVAAVLLIVGLAIITQIQRLVPSAGGGSVTSTAAPVLTPPEGMVYIPEGTFTMGTTQGNPEEGPPHEVSLSSYFIDKTEVTNKNYLLFMSDTSYPDLPANWIRQKTVNWVLDASDGFLVGDENNRFSYDGKNVKPITGSVHFDVNSEVDTGEVDVEFDGTVTYQDGVTKSGHWKIVHKTFSKDKPYFQGGVAVNVLMHGNTGQEAPFYPTMIGALATWGEADVYLDDKLLLPKIGIHTMYMKGMRDAQHEILKAPNQCCYSPQDSATGYLDPNGMDQINVILYTEGTYDQGPDVGNNAAKPVWMELYFTGVTVKSRPEAAGAIAFPPGTGDLPVTGVTWQAASAYCEYVKKRLPTEAEWEHAARGPQNFLYPWGDTSQINGNIPANWTSGSLQPVGSYPGGSSGYGALDMAGNAWEWVNDWFQADYYAHSGKNNPRGPDTGTQRVLRGGGYTQLDPTGPAEYRTTYRLYRPPDTLDSDFGFRCAKNTF